MRREVNRFYAPVMAGIEEICRIREVDLLFAAMPVDAQYYPLEVPRLVTERIVRRPHRHRRAPEPGDDGAPGGWAAGDPRRCVRRGRRLRFGRQRQRRRRPGGGRAPHRARPSRDRPRRQPSGLVPEHPPATPRVRAGDRRGRAAARTSSTSPTSPPEAAGAGGRALHRGAPGGDGRVLLQRRRRGGAHPGRRNGRASTCPGACRWSGYDDIDLARYVSPQLTTMAVDKLGHGPARGDPAAAPPGVRPGRDDAGVHPATAGRARIGPPHRRARAVTRRRGSGVSQASAASPSAAARR